MSAQHTPGPWHWIEDDEIGGAVMARLVGADGAEVCNFGVGEQYYPTEGCEPNQADASLIAAAPELLDALRLLVENGVKQSTGYGWNERLRMARAAIAKATGSAA